MAYVYEINGQRVEFTKEPTEADIDEAAKTLGPAQGGITEMLTPPPQENVDVPDYLGTAVTGFGYGGPGLKATDVYEQGIKPFGKAGIATMGKYIDNPLKAGVDVGAMLMGSPVPPVGTIEMGKSLKGAYGAAKEVFGNISDAVSKLPPGMDIEAQTLINGLRPNDISRLKADIDTKGLERGIKEFTPSGYVDDATQQSLAKIQGSFPGTGTKVARAVAPVARTAARVAGPALTGYELYEAYPTAVKAAQGDTGAMIETAKTAGEMGLGYYAGKELLKPSVIQQGIDMASKVRQMAMDKIIQPVAQAATRAAPMVRGGMGALAALTPGNVGQNYPFPMSGPMRGQEINPTTGRPWTAEELAAYRKQYGQ